MEAKAKNIAYSGIRRHMDNSSVRYTVCSETVGGAAGRIEPGRLK